MWRRGQPCVCRLRLGPCAPRQWRVAGSIAQQVRALGNLRRFVTGLARFGSPRNPASEGAQVCERRPSYAVGPVRHHSRTPLQWAAQRLPQWSQAAGTPWLRKATRACQAAQAAAPYGKENSRSLRALMRSLPSATIDGGLGCGNTALVSASACRKPHTPPQSCRAGCVANRQPIAGRVQRRGSRRSAMPPSVQRHSGGTRPGADQALRTADRHRCCANAVRCALAP